MINWITNSDIVNYRSLVRIHVGQADIIREGKLWNPALNCISMEALRACVENRSVHLNAQNLSFSIIREQFLLDEELLRKMCRRCWLTLEEADTLGSRWGFATVRLDSVVNFRNQKRCTSALWDRNLKQNESFAGKILWKPTQVCLLDISMQPNQLTEG